MIMVNLKQDVLDSYAIDLRIRQLAYCLYTRGLVKSRTGLVNSQMTLSLTKPRDTLHHGKRAANKDGRSV